MTTKKVSSKRKRPKPPPSLEERIAALEAQVMHLRGRLNDMDPWSY